MCMCFTRKFRVKEEEPPRDVKEAFEKYAEGGTQMTAEQLRRFLAELQGEKDGGGASVSDDAERIVEKVLQKRHHIAKLITKRTLSLEDFHHYLFSPDLNPPIRDQVIFFNFLLGFLGFVCFPRKCRKVQDSSCLVETLLACLMSFLAVFLFNFCVKEYLSPVVQITV